MQWPAAKTAAAFRACKWPHRCSATFARRSRRKRALKTPVARIVVRAPEDKLELLPDIERDLRASGQIQHIETFVSEALQVDVDLAPPEGPPTGPE